MIRDYLFDIGKIVEGATNGDLIKVANYTESLAAKFEAAGEKAAAKRLRQILGKSNAHKVSLARTSHSPPMPVDTESRIPVADEEHPKRGEISLFLPEEASRIVEQFLTFFKAADRLIANGVGISPSLLMYGPPGCGKTHLAKLIASELNYPLITARSDALISSYLGSTSKNLRLLFEHAASRPCVLFLDEFDAIAKMRDDDRELGELKRVVISLMQNIDAMGRDHVLLAATNHDHLLDRAIWRRFAYKLHLGEPAFGERKLMLEGFFGRFADGTTVELAAALGSGMTGAQLRDVAEDAIRAAVLDNQETVNQRAIVAQMAGGRDLAAQVKEVHTSVPQLTQKKLAELFDISQPYVSILLKQESEDAA
ncbi:MAG: ATP-binding protein [Pirellulales bacterium]